jgi:hypothetical protein
LLSVQVDTTRAASRGIGFGGEAQGPTETDEALFKARMGELYARLKGHVDGFVALKPLNFDADVDLMRAMLERQLSALSDRLREEYGVTLSWGEDALEALRVAAQRATTDKQAPTLDALQHSIVALATDALLKGDIRVGARLMLKPTSSGFEVSPQPTTVA